jgi:hypothetical protein
VGILSKPSCIKDLKKLVSDLTDRDVIIKSNLCCIREVLEDKTIKKDSTRIRRIKQILKDG